MKLTGTYKRRSINENGNVEITFEISEYRSKKECQSFEKDKPYLIDAKVKKNQRSLHQNAMLWQLIGEICMVENGHRDEQDEMEIYCSILQMAGAKCDYFECTEEAYEAFKKQFRVCTIMEERNHNGTKTVMVKAYFGSSKMNTEEMSKLIDSALQYAENVGINTDYWASQF